ncbi:MAG TPA: hypothetical protein VLU54_12215 [Casimicrobiaceae bacterium]|nr:hypothetical protein [Casimicrobiaceae bacterium]
MKATKESLLAAPLLIGSINADPKLRLVMHVGDIHSGGMPCTDAGLDPLPATAAPSWNQGILDLSAQFRDPLVYTPGDNEWTDCHKKKEGASGYPPNELAPGGAGLDHYTPFVQALADLAVTFGRPVLLLNGDSHQFEVDQPLADPTTALGLIHDTQAVPNLTCITVQGANNEPREWLRVAIDPRTSQVFTWQNVSYCDDTTCP